MGLTFPGRAQARLDAMAAVQAYVASRGAICYPRDEFSLVLPTKVLPRCFHLIVPRPGSPALGLRLRAATIQRKELWNSTTHTYLDPRTLSEGLDSVARHAVPIEPVLAFVMRTGRSTGPGYFEHETRSYNIVGMTFQDFLDNMDPRGGDSMWNPKADVTAEVFAQKAADLDRWLPRLNAEGVA